jgi:hypothetical protein
VLLEIDSKEFRVTRRLCNTQLGVNASDTGATSDR